MQLVNIGFHLGVNCRQHIDSAVHTVQNYLHDLPKDTPTVMSFTFGIFFVIELACLRD